MNQYEEHIPLDEMVTGRWYICDGRNFEVGRWTGKNFEYIRTKMGTTFKATEDHWDTGAPHGTANPLYPIVTPSDERAECYRKKGDAMTYGGDIWKSHPMRSKSPIKWKAENMAMKLVGERHEKRDLVNLVRWLIMDKAEKANGDIK
jgi:hypothetical protein